MKYDVFVIGWKLMLLVMIFVCLFKLLSDDVLCVFVVLSCCSVVVLVFVMLFVDVDVFEVVCLSVVMCLSVVLMIDVSIMCVVLVLWVLWGGCRC